METLALDELDEEEKAGDRRKSSTKEPVRIFYKRKGMYKNKFGFGFNQVAHSFGIKKKKSEYSHFGLQLVNFASHYYADKFGGVKWILGNRGESCSFTCTRKKAFCSEKGWPKTLKTYKNIII